MRPLGLYGKTARGNVTVHLRIRSARQARRSNSRNQGVDDGGQLVEGRHGDCCLAFVELDGLEARANEEGVRSIWNRPPPRQNALLPFGALTA
jgi:hypothetical protein